MANKIIFDGREYASVDEMPHEVRNDYDRILAMIGDEDHDGIPDFVLEAANAEIRIVKGSRVLMDGMEFADIGDLPSAVQLAIESAVPDVILQRFKPDRDRPSSAPQSRTPSTVQEIQAFSARDLLLVGGGVLLGATLVAVVVWLILARGL